MNIAQYHEEQDAWFSRGDRFDGFDRGDLGRPEYDDEGNEIKRSNQTNSCPDDDIEF